MVLTEKFVKKYGSNNVATIFKLASQLGYTVLHSDDDPGNLLSGFHLVNAAGVVRSYKPGQDSISQVLTELQFVLDFERALPSDDNSLLPPISIVERVNVLEEHVAKLLDNDEYEHYLKLFKAKVPCFAAAGITLEIDEQARSVTYSNPRNKRQPTRTYAISKAGYNKALRALNHVNDLARKKKSQV